MAGTPGGDIAFYHLSPLLDVTLSRQGGGGDSLGCWGQELHPCTPQRAGRRNPANIPSSHTAPAPALGTGPPSTPAHHLQG